jgi:uncharacterized hydrophobic protein (TIGR00271 family)
VGTAGRDGTTEETPMAAGIREHVLPEHQRRTLDELTDELDLRSGDHRSKQSAFWTMLVLAGVIASAGVLADSTATVIGAMIIAPLSTPIMGIALGIVKRERLRAGGFVVAGGAVVVLIGVVAALLVPGSVDVTGNPQISGRTSPTLVDLVAAVATGFAGAVGLSRRDVAAVLPGVAIAISLVPPLAVVGVCLGSGATGYALGALLLFLSNLVALVLAGTLLFAVLGYSGEADQAARQVGADRRSWLTLAALGTLVLLPLAANTALVAGLHVWTERIRSAADDWVSSVPGAEVTDVRFVSGVFRIDIRTSQDLPPNAELLSSLGDDVPDGLTIVVDTTFGDVIEVGRVGDATAGGPAS